MSIRALAARRQGISDETFPRNCRIEAVYLKVIALNDLYPTQLRRKQKDASVLFKLAKMICDLNIDDMLAHRLPDLVDKIASLKPGGKKCGYVFARVRRCRLPASSYHSITNTPGTSVRSFPTSTLSDSEPQDCAWR